VFKFWYEHKEEIVPLNLKAMKTGIIIFLLAAVSVVHHLPIHGFFGKHILHRELFFFPIVIAGLWFGLKASLLTAVVASIFCAHFFYSSIDPDRISVAVVGLQVFGYNLMALLTG
jgi:formate hydrogenlyase subunit 3/multisubunit Na+/H+ antiporter MnhD subunit